MMLLIIFITGIVFIILEMFTISFYLFMLGLAAILSSVVGYILTLIDIHPTWNSMLLLMIIFNIIVYFGLKKSNIFNKIKYHNRTENHVNTSHDSFIGIGNPVKIIQDTFDKDLLIVQCNYSGAVWKGKFDKNNLTDIDIQLLLDNQIETAKIIGNNGNELMIQPIRN